MAWVSSSCGAQGLFSSCGVRASHCGGPLAVEHGLSVHGLLELRLAGSVVTVRVLSRPAACGIFPHPGSNPRPLQWQVDS